MKRLIFYFLTLVGVIWIQVAITYFGGLVGFSANIVLVVVLYFGLSRGPIPGEVLGFILGLLVDAASLGLIGLHALLYAAAGYFAGMLRRQLDENKVWTQTIFTFGMSVFYILFYMLLDRMFASTPHPPSWSMAAQPVINAVVAPLFFWLMQHWAQFWDMAPQEE